jgi:hypothetical protein
MFKHVALGAAALGAVAGALVSATPASAVTPKVGYVWADQPTATQYAANPFWRFNSHPGEINTIKRLGAGRYEVKFPAIGATPRPGVSGSGGVAYAVAYSSTARNCKPETWLPHGSAELVRVRCTTLRGVLADSQFTASFTTGAGAANYFGYAKADRPTTTAYAPNVPFQFDSQFGTVTVHRSRAGLYEVHLPNLGGAGGTAVVTAIGANANACAVGGYGSASATQQVVVTCNRPSGQGVDTPFAVSYGHHQNLLGYNFLNYGYVLANDPTGPPYTPGAATQVNYDGTTFRTDNAVARQSTGRYVVTFRHVGVTSNGGFVTVSAFVPDGKRCQVAGWSPSGNDVLADIRCTNVNGTASPTQFIAQYVGPRS